MKPVVWLERLVIFKVAGFFIFSKLTNFNLLCLPCIRMAVFS
jgi:hypothetical protein